MKSALLGLAVTSLMFAHAAGAVEMPPEAKEFNCATCHAVDHQIVGPSWTEVAKRYKGQATYKYSSHGSNEPDAKELPLVEGLVVKISKGGSGNWGSQAMPPNNASGSKHDKLKTLVEFILTLAK